MRRRLSRLPGGAFMRRHRESDRSHGWNSILAVLRRSYVHNTTHKATLIATPESKEASMPQQDSIDRDRRAVLGAGGALILATALWSARAPAQTNNAAKVRIGVIGSGHIGGTIGGLWVKDGHKVLFSSRHPEELKDMVGASASLPKPARSSKRLPSAMCCSSPCRTALPQIGQDYGAALKGKIVLDACNATAARDGADRRGSRKERHRRDLAEISSRYAAGSRLQHAQLFDLRARGEPPRSEARDTDRRRRSRGGAKSRPGWCATPASIRWWSASSRMRAASSVAHRVTASRSPPLSSSRSCRWRHDGAANAGSGWAVPATPQERAAALWSFAYFFTLLAGYYVLRPLRDQMGIAGGVRNLPWLFTATFVTSYRGAAALRRAGGEAAARPFHSHRLSLLRRQHRVFWLLLALGVAPVIVARVFFVWVSVFNLFAVAVFWSFMADLFTAEQGKRLFGFIGAGGTAGALLGPVITIGLSVPLGPVNLLIAAAVLLELAVICVTGSSAPRRCKRACKAAYAPNRAGSAAAPLRRCPS
jgi:hypothetical protein